MEGCPQAKNSELYTPSTSPYNNVFSAKKSLWKHRKLIIKSPWPCWQIFTILFASYPLLGKYSWGQIWMQCNFSLRVASCMMAHGLVMGKTPMELVFIFNWHEGGSLFSNLIIQKLSTTRSLIVYDIMTVIQSNDKRFTIFYLFIYLFIYCFWPESMFPLCEPCNHTL